MTRSPDLSSVYLLAGSEARRNRLRSLVVDALAGADQRQLVRDLAERRLLALIGTRAIAAAPDAVSDEFRQAVDAALSESRARGLAVEAATVSIAAALAGVGIRTLPLKGPLLAAEAHGDIGLRATSDIDLLVEPRALDAAARILRERGYEEPSDARRIDGLPDLHLEMRHHTLPAVELHWRVYWYERAFSERLLARAEPGDSGLLRPAPDDLLTSLLLFYARDGFHGVRIAADIAAWWDRHGEKLKPGFLEFYVERFPQIAPALVAGASALARVTGVPAALWLGDHRRASGRVAAAARLADWAQADDVDQMSANISLAGALLRPPGYLGEFARREFLPPGERAAEVALHATKVAARYAMALWRVRGSRRWVEPPAGAESVLSATPSVQH